MHQLSPSDPNSPHRPRVAVVGGGISGLAAAHRLTELLPQAQLQLFEASDRVGGVLQTLRDGSYLIEASADNFLTRLPQAKHLCERLGLAGELLPTESARRRALVVSRGRVVPVPESFVLMSAAKMWPVFTSPVLSLRGKLRLAIEPLVPRRRETGDESVASFARRRLGAEAFERLVQPLVAGIYTADPERLSLEATLPKFLEREQHFGSLWRGRHAEADGSRESGAQYSAFAAPRQGMQQLVDALRHKLPADALRLNAPVESVTNVASGEWQVASGKVEAFDAVIIALPAPQVSRCLHELDRELASMLGQIEYAGASIVALGVARDQLSRPVDGFGFVVPRSERRQIIAASFASYKFPGRAADDRVLIRVFVGGALQPELAELADEQLLKIAVRELHDFVGLHGPPELVKIFRWPRSMPQYHVGHMPLVEAIEARAARHAGLELAGNAYRGVGIPQCIHSGELAAERVVEHLGTHFFAAGQQHVKRLTS